MQNSFIKASSNFLSYFTVALAILLSCFHASASAAVDAEMEGMEAASRGDGTFLIGGPTYIFDRVHGAGGIHSESEIWSPEKSRHRLLFNRLSVLPSWTPIEASVWVKTGNELGDMIYQDLITEKNRPTNRTPILEAGFRTSSFNGFWVTARGFQDDHFSAKARGIRLKTVDDEFALFGENWPMFSSGYAGLGFTNNFINSSILVGTDYVWIYTASSRWIPVHYYPRVEFRTDIENLSLTSAYEEAEYQNKARKEKGKRTEWNGNVNYRCGFHCGTNVFDVAAGLSFRAMKDSGVVYTSLDEDVVAWPYLSLFLNPTRRLSATATFGINDRDWLVQDSIEYSIPSPKNFGAILGVKNISGTRLNPIADDTEYFGSYVMDLTTEGQMNLLQSYMEFNDTLGMTSVGGKATLWAEHGAETFQTETYASEAIGSEIFYRERKGNAARINEWIKGFTGELWFKLWYQEMFAFQALGGFERIDGPIEKAEVTPAEFFVVFTGDWLIRRSLRLAHSLHYRSDAQWNLRNGFSDPYIVKGDWYWDMTVEQQFPKQQIYLTGTLLHVLADEAIQTVNGDYNRIRFICTVKKKF